MSTWLMEFREQLRRDGWEFVGFAKTSDNPQANFL
jgi:hypothetical protein